MYLKTVENLNMIYSIDMLRLTTRITYNDFSSLEFHIKTVFCKYLKKHYTSFSITDFKYNYIIGTEDGEGESPNTFWFGFLHNSEIPSLEEKAEYNFTIEFNPNKLKDFHVLLYILNNFGGWCIKSYDLAIDIPINILDICIPDRKRKRDFRTFSRGFDNITYYMGRSNGRVKIYNKKIESNLDIQGELTRVETSIELDNYSVSKIAFYKLDRELVELFTNDYLYTFKDYEDKTLFSVLYAIQCGFNPAMLSRRYKEKVKNLLEGGHKLIFKKSCAETVLKQVIVYYFVNNSHIVI